MVVYRRELQQSRKSSLPIKSITRQSLVIIYPSSWSFPRAAAYLAHRSDACRRAREETEAARVTCQGDHCCGELAVALSTLISTRGKTRIGLICALAGTGCKLEVWTPNSCLFLLHPPTLHLGARNSQLGFGPLFSIFSLFGCKTVTMGVLTISLRSL